MLLESTILPHLLVSRKLIDQAAKAVAKAVAKARETVVDKRVVVIEYNAVLGGIITKLLGSANLKCLANNVTSGITSSFIRKTWNLLGTYDLC